MPSTVISGYLLLWWTSGNLRLQAILSRRAGVPGDSVGSMCMKKPFAILLWTLLQHQLSACLAHDTGRRNLCHSGNFLLACVKHIIPQRSRLITPHWKYTYILAVQERASHTCLWEVTEIHSIHSQISLSRRLKKQTSNVLEWVSGENKRLFQISGRTLPSAEGLSH